MSLLLVTDSGITPQKQTNKQTSVADSGTKLSEEEVGTGEHSGDRVVGGKEEQGKDIKRKSEVTAEETGALEQD